MRMIFNHKTENCNKPTKKKERKNAYTEYYYGIIGIIMDMLQQ